MEKSAQQFDSIMKGLIQTKMKSNCSLEDKADWLVRFVKNKYPDNQQKQEELVKFAGIKAAFFN